MTRRRQHRATVRLVAALGVAFALVGGAATTSQALTLPDPVTTAVGDVTSTVTGAMGGGVPPVPGPMSPAPTPGSGAPPSHPTTSTPSTPSTSSGGSSRGGTSSNTTRAQNSGGSTASAAPAGSAAVDSPAATACIIPTGSTSPAVEVDLRAAGVDLSSPLVKQFPQALAPCPKGAVPAGDHVASVDAAVQGLLGACVRVTRQVVPLRTTLLVLDHDVIKQLTAAGVPLDRLVVPCPRAAGSTASASTPSGPVARGPVAGDRPAASALPARLAFTGGVVVPMALMGAGLLWLGVLMTRRARGFSGGAARG